MLRRDILKLGAALPLGYSASSWANKLSGTTRLVIGFPAGTSLDSIGRRFADKLTGKYSDNVIVDNRVGAAGRIAIDHVKRAAPDGRTIILMPSPLMTLYPSTYKKLTYDPAKDFVPAGVLYDSGLGLAVGPAVPQSVTNLTQFIQWAKAQPNPVFFSGNAQGAVAHFMGLEFAKRTGINVEYVPYQGGGPALTALMGGQLPLLCISMGTLAPQVSSGAVRVLASFDEKRNPLYPNVPTLKESGYPALVESEWGGMYLPAGTPNAVVASLESTLAEACRQPDLISAMHAQYLSVEFANGKIAAQRQASDTKRHREMVLARNFDPME